MPGFKSLQELFDQQKQVQSNLPEIIDVQYDPAKFGAPHQMRFSSTSLDPFSGPWTFAEAAHLLRRTIVGPTKAEIDISVAEGLGPTIDKLLDLGDVPDGPLNAFFEVDGNVNVNRPWAYKGLGIVFVNEIRNYRRESLRAWTMGLLLNHNMSIREKMVLFWHNHFPISDIKDPNMEYQYSQLLRRNALGNFKQLVKDMSINPAMLQYLNGDKNRVQAPNENYARELLELFTIGKGDLAGPGDYTTFTEHDVLEISKIMTGWIISGQNSILNINEGDLKGEFRAGRHDTSTKTLSHRFNNAVIEDGSEAEYEQLIDIIFEQEEVSKYLSRKLYRWFVYYLITDEVEQFIIEPMAVALRENNFEIRPVVELLLNSEHFYDKSLQGAMIKNPIDFSLGMINQFNLYTPINVQTEYEWWGSNATYFLSSIIQMSYFEPPDVAGWKAYYQGPVFYQIWINSVTLPFRRLITDVFSVVGAIINPRPGNPDRGQHIDGLVKIDGIALMESLDNPQEIDALLTDLGNILHPRPLTNSQKNQLKQILIPGLPDFEWTTEYAIWSADPSNPVTRTAIENKLAILLRTLMIMPEYYLG